MTCLLRGFLRTISNPKKGSTDHPDCIEIQISCNLGDHERYHGTHIGALARRHAAGRRVFEHPTAFPTFGFEMVRKNPLERHVTMTLLAHGTMVCQAFKRSGS